MSPKRQVGKETIRQNKRYKTLEISVHARINSKTPIDMAVAHTLADVRHICDDIGVNYEIADRIGGIYYTAEIGGSLR